MRNNFSGTGLSLLVLAMFLVASPVIAHHSAAGYDTEKTESAQVTLKEFRWGAPHSAVVFTVLQANGQAQDIPLASASPAAFIKHGFKPTDFKVGNKMEITWHPTRSGKPGGILVAIKFADGRIFSDEEVVNTGGHENKPGGD